MAARQAYVCCYIPIACRCRCSTCKKGCTSGGCSMLLGKMSVGTPKQACRECMHTTWQQEHEILGGMPHAAIIQLYCCIYETDSRHLHHTVQLDAGDTYVCTILSFEADTSRRLQAGSILLQFASLWGCAPGRCRLVGLLQLPGPLQLPPLCVLRACHAIMLSIATPLCPLTASHQLCVFDAEGRAQCVVCDGALP